MTASGGEQSVIVTFGFDQGTDRVREVFTASFKVGTDTNAIVSDACVMMSLLMQHGYTPRQLVERLGSPPSLIGRIILVAARIDEET